MLRITHTESGVEVGGTADDLSDVMATFLDATDPSGGGRASMRAATTTTAAGEPLSRLTVAVTEGRVSARVDGDALVFTGGEQQLLAFAGAFNVEDQMAGKVATYAPTPGDALMTEDSLAVTLTLYDAHAPAPGERPTTATVLSWVLIVLGALSLMSAVMLMALSNMPEVKEELAKLDAPMEVLYALSFISGVIHIVSGVGLLLRQSWAPWMYLVWGVLNIGTNLAIGGKALDALFGIGFYIAIAVFLFRPNVREWLATKPAKA